MEPPWDGGTKVCSNGPGHMTKIAAMPIYGKNLTKSSPEPKGWWLWNFVCNIGCSSATKFIQMMTLGWPWPVLWPGQIWSLMLLYGKKVKQWIFQKLLSSMTWNEQPMTEVSRSFCWHQKLCPLGAVCPLPHGYIHELNPVNNVYKIRHQRFLWNLQQMGKLIRPFCWHENFVPRGLSASAWGLYTCIKSWNQL